MGVMGVLEGVRVIDFTQYLPGPYATLRLADWGAEVIKVEPLKGDPARAFRLTDDDAIFSANNRNKKSITLNLKDSVGQQLALELIQTADVVMESFRPGVMAKLGLEYEKVKAKNNRIIYLSLTGFGQKSEIAALGSHDLNYLAMSGVLDQWRGNVDEPIHPSLTLADLIGGMAASEAIAAALFQREKTGQGAYIDLAIADVIFSLMTNHVMISHLSEFEYGVPFLDGSLVNYHIYETKDHRYMSLSALEWKFWQNFCVAAERLEWVDAFPDKLSIHEPLFQDMKDLFLDRTQSEWTELGEKADCCLFPVLNVGEAASSTYVQERHLVENIGGKPYVLTHHGSVTRSDGNNSPFSLGANTNEILRDILRKSDEQIREWHEKGVI